VFRYAVGMGLPGMLRGVRFLVCNCTAAVLALISAFSIVRVTSAGKTGLGSIEPGTGSFQVFNMASMLFLVWLSTRVYASMNVEKRPLPR
jgi:hypothetical protein